MSSVVGSLQRRGFDSATAEWLGRLVADWHLIADLSFSDLVLWVPDPSDYDIYCAVAQVRPATGTTALEDDVIGDELAYEPDSGVPEAWFSGEPVETSENKLQAGVPVDVLAIPVRRPPSLRRVNTTTVPDEDGDRGRADHGQEPEEQEPEKHEPEEQEPEEQEPEEDDDFETDLVAVVERHTNQMTVRAPSTLEDNYREIAEVLTGMLQRGEFPIAGDPIDPVQNLRVGDGLIRLNAAGQVSYATPNAVTGYRRLGLTLDLLDRNLAKVTDSLLSEPPPEPLTDFLDSASAREIDVVSGTVVLRLRVLPLTDADGPVPPVILCKDISEVRRRDRELVTKDATIREIHHRVKNNLQTVAALLRMQGRRIASSEGKAALAEAVSRVAAIALVHEVLSQTYDEAVDFDDVADRVLRIVADVSRVSRSRVLVRREGSFGRIPAPVATPLSLIITELCQNAIEHGLGDQAGTVTLRPERDGETLTVEVLDDGSGLPPDLDQDQKSLGLSIVGTLVSDLSGSFELSDNPGGQGTRARATVDLRAAAERH